MPKNKVSDPITDQEIAFARLILSGTMTDRRAAEAVGLNPASAAYTKAKPRVRDYMREHRAAVQRQFAPPAVGPAVDGLHRLNPDREQVLARLWELAGLNPEMTRGSIAGQVKALSIIVAMQNFIPDRRAISSEKKSAPAPAPQIYKAEWLRRQQSATTDPQQSPEPDLSSRPERPVPACRGSVVEGPAVSPNPSQSTVATPLSPSGPPSVAPYGSGFAFVPDARLAFSIQKNHLARRPR